MCTTRDDAQRLQLEQESELYHVRQKPYQHCGATYILYSQFTQSGIWVGRQRRLCHRQLLVLQLDNLPEYQHMP